MEFISPNFMLNFGSLITPLLGVARVTHDTDIVLASSASPGI